MRASLDFALSIKGFRTKVAACGQEALARLEDETFDIVVLDVLMPTLDGLETCRLLRARGDYTPVLMLTAKDAVADRVAGLEAGADDYLVKPFALEELVARVRALGRRAFGASTRGAGPPLSGPQAESVDAGGQAGRS